MSHSRYFWYHFVDMFESIIRKRNGETSLKSWKHILLNKKHQGIDVGLPCFGCLLFAPRHHEDMGGCFGGCFGG